MSTAESGDPSLGQPAPAPEVLAPLTLTPPTPVEPPVQPAVAPPVPAPAAPVPVADMRDVPLGTLIFREGLLTEEQLEEALQDGMRRGKRLGEVLLERGLVSENDLGRLLAGQKGLQFVQLDAAAIDPAAVQLLPVEKARLHSMLPIGFRDGLPVVAVADPTNDLVLENVRRSLSCDPHLVVAGREALQRHIEAAYEAVPVLDRESAAVVAPAPVTPVVQAQPVAPFTAPPEPVVPALAPEPAAPVAPPVAPTPVVPLEPQPAATREPVQPAPAAQTVEPVQPAPAVPQPVEPEPILLSEPVAPVIPAVAAEPVQPVVETPPVAEPVPAALSITPLETPAEAPPVEPSPAAEAAIVVAEPPASERAPEPTPSQDVFPPAEDPVADDTWYVVVRLADGERIDAGAFHSATDAREHAKNVVEQISSDDGWPFFDGRFLRPEGIVSVDLVEPEGRWLGSAARRAWAAPLS